MFAQDFSTVANSVVIITLENYFGYLIAGGLALYAPGQLERLGGANSYDRISYWAGYFTLGFIALFSALVFYAILFSFRKELIAASLATSIRKTDSLIAHLESYLNANDAEKQERVSE